MASSKTSKSTDASATAEPAATEDTALATDATPGPDPAAPPERGAQTAVGSPFWQAYLDWQAAVAAATEQLVADSKAAQCAYGRAVRLAMSEQARDQVYAAGQAFMNAKVELHRSHRAASERARTRYVKAIKAAVASLQDETAGRLELAELAYSVGLACVSMPAVVSDAR